MKNSIFLLLLISLCFSSISQAQESEKDNFLEALYLMDEKRFAEAQPLLKELLEAQPENANLNFNMGLAMANSPSKQDQIASLDYFERSIEGVDPNYTPYSVRESGAPVDAYYYYGRALHARMRFDDAIQNYKKFQAAINEKHYLYEDVQNRIGMSEYAKTAVENPRNVEFSNLGEQLNSKYPDYSPAIRIDESAIYFTSRRLRGDSSNRNMIDPIDGQYFEDIYIAFNDDGVWSEPRQLNISTDENEATLTLSTDGQTLFIYKGDDNNGALYKSQLKGDSAGFEQWSTPELLGSNINDPKANETHVSIAADGKMLYFTSDREGGFGGLDLYFCRKLPNGEWADAVNMGPTINTRFNEDGVYIHPDGVTLYFSSQGHPSMGGYDIFTSTLTENGWEKPINLGYPVNSLEDDIFFNTTPDGKRAYFSSYKEDSYGETDIYMLKLIDAEEIPLTLYRGKFVYMNSDRPPAGALVTVVGNSDGELVGVYSPRQRDGEFSMILEPNQSYHIIYEADGFEPYEEDILVPEDSSYQEIYKDIKLKAVEVDPYQKDGSAQAMSKGTELGSTPFFNGAILAGVEVQLLDENGNLIKSNNTNEDGSFKFTKLDMDNSYQVAFVGTFPDENTLIFTNEKGQKLTFVKVREGVYQYVPRPMGSPMRSYTLSVSDEKAFKDTYPKPTELKGVIVYFQKYFPYNATEINVNNPEFKSFINDVANVIKDRGYASIIITSSASKVPTRSFKSNTELTKQRAYDTKQQLEKVLKAKGLEDGDYNFVDINTLITGPEYKNDASTNRSKYEKYQYVRIFIK
jgi:hypothetical protein